MLRPWVGYQWFQGARSHTQLIRVEPGSKFGPSVQSYGEEQVTIPALRLLQSSGEQKEWE